jgi:hypothetical protein
MDKKVFLFVFVLLILLGVKNASSKMIDCKSNLSCFVEKSINCTPSTVQYTATINLFGMNTTGTSLMKIRGLEEGKCEFYIKNKNIKIKFTDELVQALMKENLTEKEVKKLEIKANNNARREKGKEGVCKFDTPDLTTMLTKWNNGQFSSTDFYLAECRGSYFK